MAGKSEMAENWVDDSELIRERLKSICGNGDVVVLCIGSDRVTGDSLGPIVGQLLTRYYNIPAFVYGTLEHPVTALNLRAVMSSLRRRHGKAKIIAVDSCVGESSDVGQIRTAVGGLRPGSAIGKNLPKVGHASITAVTSDQIPTSIAFASVRLGLVYKMSESIAKGIHLFLKNEEELKTS